MSGFNVSYIKDGQAVKVFAPTEREAKRLLVEALRDPGAINIGVKQA